MMAERGILNLEILKRKPIRSILRRRPTIILKKPLVELLGLDPPQLPPGVTLEEAIEVVAATPWATNLAIGFAKRMGYEPCTPEYPDVVNRIRYMVARGLVT